MDHSITANNERRRSVVHVVGVPFNSAGTPDGVALAPDAIRRAGLIEPLADVGIEFIDRGNVTLLPGGPLRDPGSGLIAPAALTAMIRAVRSEVMASLGEGGFPLVLGGDCPVLLGCLPAHPASHPLGLLFVDGHEDAWPPTASTTGEAADMELGFALGRTIDGLPKDLITELPRLSPERLTVIGARDHAELAEAGVGSLDDAVRVVRPGEIGDRPADLGAFEASRLAAGGPWWLHVDLDVLSSDSLAAVDYPQPGGLDWRQLTALTRGAIGVPNLQGWTVTIYNPDLDAAAASARRIVEYIAGALSTKR